MNLFHCNPINKNFPSPRGLTLLELLVAMVIGIILTGAGYSAYSALHRKARLTTEMGAGRALIQAYLGYAAENNGRVLPGYQTDPDATNDRGELLHHPMNARYPWRLAPFLPSIEGTLVPPGQRDLLDSPDRDYLVSVSPSLGLNTVMMGGHFGSGSPLRPDPRLIQSIGRFNVTHLSQVNTPSRMLVFCSARHQESGPDAGNFEVRPPNLLAPNWSPEEFSPSADPSAHGMVDFRWSGKAVAVFLGGNAELLNESELRDMRLWSNLANIADDPNHLLRHKR